jgi:hypothetical protein
LAERDWQREIGRERLAERDCRGQDLLIHAVVSNWPTLPNWDGCIGLRNKALE